MQQDHTETFREAYQQLCALTIETETATLTYFAESETIQSAVSSLSVHANDGELGETYWSWRRQAQATPEAAITDETSHHMAKYEISFLLCNVGSTTGATDSIWAISILNDAEKPPDLNAIKIPEQRYTLNSE